MRDMILKLIFSLLVLCCKNVFGIPRIDPLVETEVGLIRGLRASDGDYSMFLGIPYGKVDENNPFGPSTAFPKFDGTFEAYNDTAICPQLDQFSNTIIGTLDCLHLNIYVPKSASSQSRLPVLVWIHGGYFARGFAGRYLYGPKYLIRHDVILVTLNYRLGPYGFMCLGTPEVPGNQGLKDQLLALRWIQKNIESFGGDVSKVTLMGESSGGRSVDYHLYSDKEPLFRNVILQSGTSLLIRMITETKPNMALELAEKNGFVTDDLSKALSFLAQVDPYLIIAAAADMERFLPCVEKQFDNVENFISDYSMNLLIPKVKGMDVLIGHNNDEMLVNCQDMVLKDNDDFDDFKNGLQTEFNFNDKQLIEMEEIVRHFYIGEEEINQSLLDKICDFESDLVYNHPTERSIAKYILNGVGNLYHYVFSYNGGRNLSKKRINVTEGGAAHADELGYLFDVSYWPEEPAPEDQLIIDRMTTMWTNFVKYSDPTPETSELLPVKWEPIVEDSPYFFMNITLDINLDKRPFHDRMAFWDLFYKLNEKMIVGYKDG